MRARTMILGLGVGPCLVACDIFSPDTPSQSVAEIRITAVSDTLKGIERSYQLHATVLDVNGAETEGAELRWSSSHPDIAILSSTGVVQTVGAGSMTIFASSGVIEGSLPLVVADRAAMITGTKGPICALDHEGFSYCWAVGSTPDLPLGGQPTLMSDTLIFHSIAGGWDSSVCGLTTGGRAYCWGRNEYGQLGDGSTMPRATPTAVAGDLLFRHVRTSTVHSCGIAQDGDTYCWGWNGVGQLGAPASDICQGDPCSLSPVRVNTDLRFRSLSLTGSTSCGLDAVGALYCWGGEPTLTFPAYRFSQVAQTAATRGEGCGIADDQLTYCWTHQNGLTPEAIGGPPLVYISEAVGEHYCGLTASGAAHCWGYNRNGEFGNGAFGNGFVPTPTPVAGGIAFLSLATGTGYTCGITASESYCWGRHGASNADLGLVDESAGVICDTSWVKPCFLTPQRARFNP